MSGKRIFVVTERCIFGEQKKRPRRTSPVDMHLKTCRRRRGILRRWPPPRSVEKMRAVCGGLDASLFVGRVVPLSQLSGCPPLESSVIGGQFVHCCWIMVFVTPSIVHSLCVIR